MRRTATSEAAPAAKSTKKRPDIVVHDPEPKAGPDQVWTLTSYPFYDPRPQGREEGL